MGLFGARKVTCAQCGRKMKKGGVKANAPRKDRDLALVAGEECLRCSRCGRYLCLPCVAGHSGVTNVGTNASTQSIVIAAVIGKGICPFCREQTAGQTLVKDDGARLEWIAEMDLWG